MRKLGQESLNTKRKTLWKKDHKQQKNECPRVGTVRNTRVRRTEEVHSSFVLFFICPRGYILLPFTTPLGKRGINLRQEKVVREYGMKFRMTMYHDQI